MMPGKMKDHAAGGHLWLLLLNAVGSILLRLLQQDPTISNLAAPHDAPGG